MKLRRLKGHPSDARAFESELALEIMKSDKMRVTILICAFGVVVPAILALAVFGFEEFQGIFHGNFKSFLTIVLGVLILGLGCLVVEWFVINRLIRSFGDIHPFMGFHGPTC